MRLSILSIFTMTLSTLQLNAQATVPLNFDFENQAYPTGWTAMTSTGSNPTGRYTTNGCGGATTQAGRLDATGEYFTVNFASAPGALTYCIKGYNTGAIPFLGTFDVQQSVDGNTWSTLRNYVNSDINSSAYATVTDNPLSTSRFIRFFFTSKTSGHNLSIDDVIIAAPAAGPAQEINVQRGNVSIPSGLSTIIQSSVGSTNSIALEINNLGLVNSLNIASAVITPASDYALSGSTFPRVVTNQTGFSLAVQFTPSVSGTRPGILTITSNDADESVYTIYINGIGGSFATEPSTAPSISVTDNKSYKLGVNVTAVNTENILVLKKTGTAPITVGPTDGITYKVGDLIGGAKVCFVTNNMTAGTINTTFNPREVEANTVYQLAVYSFNGPNGYQNYRATGTNTSSTTPNGRNDAYYSTINPNATDFIPSLSSLINTHTSFFYSNYKNLILEDFEIRDTTNEQRVTTCRHSGQQIVFTPPFDWTALNLSRDHVWAHSWMPTYPADNPEKPEYSDWHNLFVSNFTDVNQVRSNYPFGVVVNATSTFLGSKLGRDANNLTAFEVQDATKGDVARAIFYMAIAYNGINSKIWKLYATQNENLLRQWHYQDLPSNYEIGRNDYIASKQGNRNPFIDFPDWVCKINFKQLIAANLQAPCTQLVNVQENPVDFNIYPNPSENDLVISWGNNSVATLEISNLLGQVLKTENVLNINTKTIDINDLPNGIYFVKLNNAKQMFVKQ